MMEATQLAREVAEAKKQASYALGVEEIQEIQARLTEELAEACRDYCNVTQVEALNVAGVPANSKQRQPRRIYYHPDIREAPDALPSPYAQNLESSKQPLTTALPLPEVSKGSNQAGDQFPKAEGAKDKGKGKEIKPPLEAEDVAAKAKVAEARTTEADHKAKDAPKPKDPPHSKGMAQNL